MRSAFQTSEDFARLVAEAESWLNTPYAPDGAVKNSGVSCAMLPYSILKNCGHESPTPPGRNGLSNSELMRAMIAWLDSHPASFKRLDPFTDSLQGGDVLVMKSSMGHLFLAKDANTLVHCWPQGGVQELSRDDPSIRNPRRIAGAWRPVVDGV